VKFLEALVGALGILMGYLAIVAVTVAVAHWAWAHS